MENKIENVLNYDINQVLQEVDKYEEIVDTGKKQKSMSDKQGEIYKKSTKKRKITSFFTKTQETANARMGAYLCIAGDEKMWENKNYFELVMMEEGKDRCVGTVMLVNIEANDGKRYLFFGPNPFEGFLDSVSDSACLDYLYDVVVGFAIENNFDGIVIPSSESKVLGACTNRGGEFPNLINAKRLKDRAVIVFGGEHHLGGIYSYKDGALIWSKS